MILSWFFGLPNSTVVINYVHTLKYNVHNTNAIVIIIIIIIIVIIIIKPCSDNKNYLGSFCSGYLIKCSFKITLFYCGLETQFTLEGDTCVM